VAGILVVVLVVVLVLPGQFALRPIRVRQLVALPAVALALGAIAMWWEGISLSGAQLTYFAVQICIAVACGAARGNVIRIIPRGPFALRFGGWPILAAWAGTLLARVIVDVVARALAGATGALLTSFPLFIGLTLGVQHAVLAARVRRTGLRFVPPRGAHRWRRNGRWAGPASHGRRPDGGPIP
jgi:hypothetical protein